MATKITDIYKPPFDFAQNTDESWNVYDDNGETVVTCGKERVANLVTAFMRYLVFIEQFDESPATQLPTKEEAE